MAAIFAGKTDERDITEGKMKGRTSSSSGKVIGSYLFYMKVS